MKLPTRFTIKNKMGFGPFFILPFEYLFTE